MKKKLLILLTTAGIILPSFSAVQTAVCSTIGDTTGCQSCFTETSKLYACNPHQSSCQNQQIGGMYDTVHNTGNTSLVMYDDDKGTTNFTKLQAATTWSYQDTVTNMFEATPEYYTPAGPTPGEQGYKQFAGSNRWGYFMNPNTSLKWTQMKTAGWLRAESVTQGASGTLPAFRVAFTPRLYSNSTTYLDHRQCVFYYVRFCGDNVIDDGAHGTTDRGEQCDDGNMTSGDGCSNTCTTESQTLSCTSLALSPTTLSKNGGDITATCTANPTSGTQYKIVLKQGDTIINPNDTYQSSNTKTFTLPANTTTSDKNYFVDCFVKNGTQTDITANACKKSITVPGTIVVPDPVCTNLTVTPNAVTDGGSVTLTCTGSGTITDYSIVIKKPDGSSFQTLTSNTGSVTIPATPTGDYTAKCYINNQTTTPPDCQKVITNTGSVAPVCTSLTGIPSTLETGESFTYSCHSSPAKTGTKYSISGITPPIVDGISNTGTYTDTHTFSTAGSHTVSCRVNGAAQVPDCQKTVTVTVPTTPNITIDKRDDNSADTDGAIGNDTQTVVSGATAVFKIRVTNNGTEDLKNLELTDTIAPNCAGSVTLGSTPTYPTSTWSNFATGGSGNHTDALLQPGEYFEYTCNKSNTTENYTNTARIDAVGNTSNQSVSSSDPSPVILAPTCNSLTLSHTTVEINTPIRYVCSATNATSYIIKRDSTIVSYLPEGTMSFLTAGTYSIGCFIDGQTSGPTACGKSISVTNPPVLTIPSIFIDKDDSTPGIPDSDGNDIQRVQENGTATFTILVRNNGNEALKTVVIDDPLASDCARTATQTAPLYAGGTSTNFDIGESFTYICTKNNVTNSTFTSNRNTASVKGVGVTSGTNVTDSDVTEIFLKQINPSIIVEKDDSDNLDDEQEIDEDETAKFSVIVTNDGDEVLENVVLEDALSPDCDRDESETRDMIRKIGNYDSLFDPGEEFAYLCKETSVSVDTFPDEINTVCVDAKGVDTDKSVDDCDDTNITVNEITESLMCYGIESSEGTFGGAPFRTTISCDVEESSSCIIEVTKDGEVINEYDACTKNITLADPGEYSVACIVDDERASDCEMGITVEAMTDVPTGTKILIIAFLSLILSTVSMHFYKKKST